MHKVEDLKIWEKALKLTKEVYFLISELPLDEKYGLSSQITLRVQVGIPLKNLNIF